MTKGSEERESSGEAVPPSHTRAPEHRWPAATAVIGVLVLWALLPSTFYPPLRYAAVAVGVIALIPLIALNPTHLERESRWSRPLSLGLSLLLLAVNQVLLVQLVFTLLDGSAPDARSTLLSALQVWATNVTVFALVFWELDRRGPVARNLDERDDLVPADFRFPQDEDHDAIQEVAARSSQKANWRPSFMDYLYTSITCGIAFSAADAMPLSHRVKALMALQAVTAYILGILVVAFAVGTLG